MHPEELGTEKPKIIGGGQDREKSLWRNKMKEEITLPREVQPMFPKRCVVCNQPNNNEFVEVESKLSEENDPKKWELLGRNVTKVPAHSDCYRGMKHGVLKRKILYISLIIVCVVGLSLMETYDVLIHFEINKITLVIVGLILSIPIFILEEKFPPPFELRVSEKKVKYGFKNKDYAIEFNQLNQPKLPERRSLKEIAIDFLLDQKYLEAVKASTDYIELKPDDSYGYEMRGEALLRLKRFDQALNDFDKSLEISGENTNALWLRTITYRKLKRYSEAKADRQMAKIIESESDLISRRVDSQLV
jgi:hypothetical protein